MAVTKRERTRSEDALFRPAHAHIQGHLFDSCTGQSRVSLHPASPGGCAQLTLLHIPHQCRATVNLAVLARQLRLDDERGRRVGRDDEFDGRSRRDGARRLDRPIIKTMKGELCGKMVSISEVQQVESPVQRTSPAELAGQPIEAHRILHAPNLELEAGPRVLFVVPIGDGDRGELAVEQAVRVQERGEAGAGGAGQEREEGRERFGAGGREPRDDETVQAMLWRI